MSGQIVGLVSGQAFGGFFADTIGWRWGFVFLAVIYFIAGVFLLRAQRHLRPQANSIGNDGPGAFAGIAMVLRSGRARWILGIVFVEAMATFGVIAFIPAHLHEHFGISLFHAGAVVAVFGLGGLLYTSMARRWVRALGEVRLALLGGVLLAVAFLVLAQAPTWHWAIGACLIAGLGFYQLHNTLQTQATQMAPAARGTAVSIFASSFFLGQALGVSMGALVVEHFGAVRLFAVSALLLPLVGWVFAGYLRRQARQPRATP
jgi:predicted MFS family arabinose efflux permease